MIYCPIGTPTLSTLCPRIYRLHPVTLNHLTTTTTTPQTHTRAQHRGLVTHHRVKLTNRQWRQLVGERKSYKTVLTYIEYTLFVGIVIFY